jgi:hypothetical protein
MTNSVFHYLFSQYKTLVDQGLASTEGARHLFGEMMAYAPPEYMKAAHRIAVEMGLFPDRPDGYSDDGQPLYNMEAMCERLGINPDDVPEYITKDGYAGTVHRVQ